jgi:hypothetical protein
MKENCTPISSNCITWTGPNIPCIKLCKGDSITDVVYNFAMSYCDLLSQLDPSKYNLACLNDRKCPPKSFQELVQLLITKICDVEKQEGPQGPAGENGNDGQNGNSVRLVPATEQCPCGGTIVQIIDFEQTVLQEYFLCSGCDGDDGSAGEPGPTGPTGPKGDKGDPGADGICEDCIDTGWHDLLGFCHQIRPPQARRIGNVIHFRGAIVVPLTDGAGGFLKQTTSGRLYEESRFVAAAEGAFSCNNTGTTGVELDTSGGSIRFNNFENVIPAQVLDMQTNTLDQSYRLSQKIGTRRVLVAREDVFVTEQNTSASIETEYATLTEGSDTSTHPAGGGHNTSALLSTMCSVAVLNNGQMIMAVVRDGEETGISEYRTSYSFNTSHLNYLISHVRVADYLFSFRADGSGTTIHSDTNLPAPPVVKSINAEYELFNGHTSLSNRAKYQYKFSCNANDETELGGFGLSIDGLTAFVAP